MFGCHMIFIRHAVRFQHFSHIIRIRQERGQEIMNMQQNYSNSHLITDEEIVSLSYQRVFMINWYTIFWLINCTNIELYQKECGMPMTLLFNKDTISWIWITSFTIWPSTKNIAHTIYNAIKCLLLTKYTTMFLEPTSESNRF